MTKDLKDVLVKGPVDTVTAHDFELVRCCLANECQFTVFSGVATRSPAFTFSRCLKTILDFCCCALVRIYRHRLRSFRLIFDPTTLAIADACRGKAGPGASVHAVS